MNQSKAHQKVLLAELAVQLKQFDLAFRLFSLLHEDTDVKHNIYLYSSILFGLGICNVALDRCDIAYVQFMKANTVFPNSRWVTFASENAAFCIQELGGEELSLKRFIKNTKRCKNTDNYLSLAYHAYYLNTVRENSLNKELKLAQYLINIDPSQEIELTDSAYKQSIEIALKTSYKYLKSAYEINPNDIIVLKSIGNLLQEMKYRGIKEWMKEDNILFSLATFYRNEKQPHKAQKIYHDWFKAIEEKRLAEGRAVSMLHILKLESECYEEMGLPREAIRLLKRVLWKN